MRQVLWLSVVLYKSPESELTCCLLLSTDAIYFLLEDSASNLGHQSGGWWVHGLDLVSPDVMVRKYVNEIIITLTKKGINRFLLVILILM